MEPIDFKGRNVIYGEDQPEYIPLPAMRLSGGEVYSCWQLSDDEIEEIVKNKCLYISQLVYYKKDESGKEYFGKLQPLMPMVNLGDNLKLM